MNRVLRRALPLCAVLLGAAGTSLALPFPEGPVGPEGGHGGQDEIQELAKKISRELRENEEALAKLARGEKAEPKKVDIELPSDGKSGKTDSPPPSGGT